MKRNRRSRPPCHAPTAFAGSRFQGCSSSPPELIGAARPHRHTVDDRWFTGETYVKVSGAWRYVYRAVDQHGQVIHVFVTKRWDIASVRRSFITALASHRAPAVVITGGQRPGSGQCAD